MEAPFGNPEWETWGMANDARVGGFDRVFEIHPPETLNESHRNRLEKQRESIPGLVTSATFPFSEIEKFWNYGLDSTAAYMLVLAMHENWNAKRKIGLWGFNMATTDEYGTQRDNMLMLIGFARGSGFELWIHPQSKLNLPKQYYPYPLEKFVTPFPAAPIRVGKMRASQINNG